MAGNFESSAADFARDVPPDLRPTFSCRSSLYTYRFLLRLIRMGRGANKRAKGRSVRLWGLPSHGAAPRNALSNRGSVSLGGWYLHGTQSCRFGFLRHSLGGAVGYSRPDVRCYLRSIPAKPLADCLTHLLRVHPVHA